MGKKEKKKKNKIIIIIVSIVVLILIFVTALLIRTTQSFYGVAFLDDTMSITFEDGVSQPILARYLNWDGRSVMIFVGRGGIPDSNFPKDKYVKDLRTSFLLTLKLNGVEEGTKCEVRVSSIQVKKLDGYSGIPPEEYPIPGGQWLSGSLMRVQQESDPKIKRMVTSGGQPVFGYNDFDCVLDVPYPIIGADGSPVGDLYTIHVRIVSRLLPDCETDSDCIGKVALQDCGGGVQCIASKCVYVCAECFGNTGCEEGEKCVSEKCIPKTEFDWLPIAIAGVLVMVILMGVFIFKGKKPKRKKKAKRKKKKKKRKKK